jgi:hypothetical protein
MADRTGTASPGRSPRGTDASEARSGRGATPATSSQVGSGRHQQSWLGPSYTNASSTPPEVKRTRRKPSRERGSPRASQPSGEPVMYTNPLAGEKMEGGGSSGSVRGPKSGGTRKASELMPAESRQTYMEMGSPREERELQRKTQKIQESNKEGEREWRVDWTKVPRGQASESTNRARLGSGSEEAGYPGARAGGSRSFGTIGSVRLSRSSHGPESAAASHASGSQQSIHEGMQALSVAAPSAIHGAQGTATSGRPARTSPARDKSPGVCCPCLPGRGGRRRAR